MFVTLVLTLSDLPEDLQCAALVKSAYGYGGKHKQFPIYTTIMLCVRYVEADTAHRRLYSCIMSENHDSSGLLLDNRDTKVAEEVSVCCEAIHHEKDLPIAWCYDIHS